MDFLDKLSLEDLDEEQQELADCIGIEAYKKLIVTYAGSTITIRHPERLTRKLRNEAIRSEFNGVNYNALALKYHISNRMIRYIVNGKSK